MRPLRLLYPLATGQQSNCLLNIEDGAKDPEQSTVTIRGAAQPGIDQACDTFVSSPNSGRPAARLCPGPPRLAWSTVSEAYPLASPESCPSPPRPPLRQAKTMVQEIVRMVQVSPPCPSLPPIALLAHRPS